VITSVSRFTRETKPSLGTCGIVMMQGWNEERGTHVEPLFIVGVVYVPSAFVGGSKLG